jgi:hypothetical protein
MMFMLLAMIVSFVIPSVFYARNMSRASMLWPAHAHREKTEAHAGSGAFRATTLQSETQTEIAAGPPTLLRIAAFSGYYLGQMVIPGLLMGFVGVMVATSVAGKSNAFLGLLGLLGSVGALGVCIYAAISVWSAANAMFESRFEVAEQRAKRALLFANIINIPTILIALLAALINRDVSPMGFAIYPIISLVQAAFVLFAVRSHETEFREAYAAALPLSAHSDGEFSNVRVQADVGEVSAVSGSASDPDAFAPHVHDQYAQSASASADKLRR